MWNPNTFSAIYKAPSHEMEREQKAHMRNGCDWHESLYLMTNQSSGCDTNGFFSGDRAAFVTYVPPHLDRVTDDYFGCDPVRDTVGISEQLLEVAFWWRALTHKGTAALCWRDLLWHIPVVRKKERLDLRNDKLLE